LRKQSKVYKKHKILIIGPTPPPYYGVSIATRITLDGLGKKGWTVIHLDTSDRRTLKNLGRLDLFNIYLGVYHLLKLIKLILIHRPKIVYLPISQGTWGFVRDSLFIFLAKLFRRKVIVHLRGGYFWNFYENASFFMKIIIKFTLLGVSSGIVQGECLKYHLTRFIPAAKVKVVPNGLDPKPFFENFKVTKRPDVIRVLFLSNLIEAKGFLDVIRTIPFVVKEKRDIHFIFAGAVWSNSDYERAKNLIKKFGIEKFVEFTGEVKGKEKIQLLNSCDIFVFPTFYKCEGQPWVILEAMACGLPIITTDQGCIKEVVKDGECGFIIEKNNPLQIAQKILLLSKNYELRAKMGDESRKQLISNYTTVSFINKLEKVFEKVS
jgi:glycosyltransferase involved in cell wall biosynthesis